MKGIGHTLATTKKKDQIRACTTALRHQLGGSDPPKARERY